MRPRTASGLVLPSLKNCTGGLRHPPACKTGGADSPCTLRHGQLHIGGLSRLPDMPLASAVAHGQRLIVLRHMDDARGIRDGAVAGGIVGMGGIPRSHQTRPVGHHEPCGVGNLPAHERPPVRQAPHGGGVRRRLVLHGTSDGLQGGEPGGITPRLPVARSDHAL